MYLFRVPKISDPKRVNFVPVFPYMKMCGTMANILFDAIDELILINVLPPICVVLNSIALKIG